MACLRLLKDLSSKQSLCSTRKSSPITVSLQAWHDLIFDTILFTLLVKEDSMTIHMVMNPNAAGSGGGGAPPQGQPQMPQMPGLPPGFQMPNMDQINSIM